MVKDCKKVHVLAFVVYIGLVLAGGHYHDLERYHDFAVEIMFSEYMIFTTKS